MATHLIQNIKTLAGIDYDAKTAILGLEMAKLEQINNAYLLIEDGKIAAFGEMKDCPEGGQLNKINANGQTVLPAWCDSHSHIVYAGSREGEFVDRIKGKSYEEIAENGGGILNSAKRLQETSESALYDQALERLHEVIGFGTGALEIKSGYGLTYEAELKILRVIRRIKETASIPIKATFLGAHAIPTEYKQDRAAYIKLVTDRMIPQVAAEGLADYCDVFCDKGFFTPAEADHILKVGKKHGLIPKLHANELDYSGGIQVGVANDARSVDHLEFTGEEEIAALMTSETMSTLLPSTAFFLSLPFAPARAMMEAGLPLALGTDYNPGTTPSGKMSFVISLACIKMKMLPEEAINAATLNGAYAMNLEKTHGSICVGKQANLIFTKKIPSLAFIPYSFGSDLIDKVMVNGRFQ